MINSLDECARHLARLRPSYSDRNVRSLISVLAKQCENYPHNPEALRKMIPHTIDAVREATVAQQER